MEEKDSTDKMISDEGLRLRIRKIIPEQKQSGLEKLSRHPLTTLVIGFLLTWGIGGLLTDKLKASNLENQRKSDQIREKRENGLLAISKITELMYDRYTVSTLLASSLKRKAPLEELKERKKLYDESYLKWNKNLQITQLTVRGLTTDTAYSKIEAVIQHNLVPHYQAIDSRLTNGFDARLKNQSWTYDSLFIINELEKTRGCCYTISNYLWIKANLYGDEKYRSLQVVKQAENELYSRCK